MSELSNSVHVLGVVVVVVEVVVLVLLLLMSGAYRRGYKWIHAPNVAKIGLGYKRTTVQLFTRECYTCITIFFLLIS